ncbi:carbohydrate ABC transporter permease [Galbitalea sp. SE-J8]|uniref:carbohydrate ABC transporter permease n=1 Tax=Galbitalea sp. SE-J8 TaxID=3054952 RepID=UPI00259C8EB7|nr:carbohydrate ABC transporter permease [Galbitalea sp. SE-J8]
MTAQTAPRRRRRVRPQSVINYALALVVAFAYLFPLLFVLNTSLKSDQDFFRNPVGLVTSPQFGNFVEAWNRGHFGALIGNSVLYTLAAAGLGTLVSLMIGFPVSRGYFKHSRAWYGLFVVLLFLPNAIITQFQLLLRIGLYNSQLGYILIMAAAVGVGPILIAAYARSIPIELDEAAAVDGAGYWRYLFTFVVPLARPALATVFILQAIGIWNDIILATVLLPDRQKAPISLGLYAFQGTYNNEWGLLAAATLIVAAPLVVAFLALQRYLIGGIVGSVKG